METSKTNSIGERCNERNRNMKIKIIGLGNVFYEGEQPEPNTDYLLTLRVALEGEYTPKAGGEDEEKRYDMKVVVVEGLENTKTRIPLKVKKGKSKSQELRFTIFPYLNSIGEIQSEENYERVMDYLIRVIRGSKGKRSLWDKIVSLFE